MKRIPKLELMLGVVSLLSTLTIFVAQGPYNNLWQYGVAFSPIFAAVIFIVGCHAFLRVRHFVLALLHAKEAYDLVTATDITSKFAVRILNLQGDLLYERDYHVILLKDKVTIRKTKTDLVGSEVAIENFPPTVKLASSKPSNIRLLPTDVTFYNPVRAGRPHYEYSWAYEISPPLRNRGDFIDYSYSAVIPLCETKAFTDTGSIFYFRHESLPLEVCYTLLSPPNYRISITDSWLENADGQRSELSRSDSPSLDESAQLLTWKPSYRRRMCFMCRYRLVPSESYR